MGSGIKKISGSIPGVDEALGFLLLVFRYWRRWEITVGNHLYYNSISEKVTIFSVKLYFQLGPGTGTGTGIDAGTGVGWLDGVGWLASDPEFDPFDEFDPTDDPADFGDFRAKAFGESSTPPEAEFSPDPDVTDFPIPYARKICSRRSSSNRSCSIVLSFCLISEAPL